jgi:hypothetical protein
MSDSAAPCLFVCEKKWWFPAIVSGMWQSQCHKPFDGHQWVKSSPKRRTLFGISHEFLASGQAIEKSDGWHSKSEFHWSIFPVE